MIQLLDPTYSGGANRPSLLEGQLNYAAFGACEERGRAKARQPNSDEARDPRWRRATAADVHPARVPRELTCDEYDRLETWYYWLRDPRSVDVRVLRLTRDNAQVVERLAPAVFDDPIEPAQLAAFLGDARHVMFVAVAGDVVIGMASGVEYFHPDKRPQLWINEVAVTPARQRRGLGRRLVNALLAEARERGCSVAWLGTASDNTAGQACVDRVAGGSPRVAFWMYEWELDG
jgi:aminoglycoside 6'-N-acetyltransferase I